MIKFYLKLQNNLLVNNLLYIITALVLGFNIIVRIMSSKFINVPWVDRGYIIKNLSPTSLFMYCDVYLLMLFVILIFFFLGTDFKNSMEEISLSSGSSRINKFMMRKLYSLLLLYLFLYIITFTNIYTLYPGKLSPGDSLFPLKEIVFYSLTSNLFVISLSLLLIFLTRDIAVSTTIVTAFYLVEEALWRCRVTETNGILGHIYWYSEYGVGELYKVKEFYLLLSVVFLFLTYKLSQRKVIFIGKI